MPKAVTSYLAIITLILKQNPLLVGIILTLTSITNNSYLLRGTTTDYYIHYTVTSLSMKVIIKLIFYVCVLISASAVLIGFIYLLVNGLDVFLQYRLYILSKPLTYVVIGIMALCVLINSFTGRNREK